MENILYHYNAKVTKVYDGDTITVDIDLGMKLILKGEKIRLYGINTPEVRGIEREDGLKSRDFLSSMILGKDILIKTIKDKKGKYGRYLGEIYHKDENGEYINLNKMLVDNGYAVYKNY